MLSSRGKIGVCSAAVVLLCGVAAVGLNRHPAPPEIERPLSFPSRGVVGGLSLNPASLSASNRRSLAAVEKILRSDRLDGATESVLWQALPDLLAAGGAPLVDRLLAETPPGALRETLLRLCEIEWSRVDAAAALAWTAHLSDPAARRGAFERELSSLSEFDPAQAVQASAARDASGEIAGAFTASLVDAWASADLRGARQWTLSLPPGERRDACVANVAMVEARSFPAEAARFALQRLPPGPVLDETLVTTLYYWSGRDASQARQWVETFPPGALRDRGLAEVNDVSAVVPVPVGDLPPNPSDTSGERIPLHR